MGIHIILIIVIGAISVYGFSNQQLVEQLQFNAWKIVHQKQYYRLITHAFVHGGWTHLLVNMFVLYSFGNGTILLFNYVLEINGELWFFILFVSSIVISSIYSLVKEKDNFYYNALGASGGVMAIVFTTIVFEPYNLIYVYFLPVPAIVFGVVYLVYSKIMSKKNIDNIGHDAHFWGALYGFLFPIALNSDLAILFFYKLISIL
ncbi:MAG: rhomboid family intramembrane serine protease [Marinilabiliaceae bacterium]|nr:rhomboid family intramembrane serine protease [Marinilabiliaceae bacterium]